MCRSIWTVDEGVRGRVVGVQCCNPGCGALIKLGEHGHTCPVPRSEPDQQNK